MDIEKMVSHAVDCLLIGQIHRNLKNVVMDTDIDNITLIAIKENISFRL